MSVYMYVKCPPCLRKCFLVFTGVFIEIYVFQLIHFFLLTNNYPPLLAHEYRVGEKGLGISTDGRRGFYSKEKD